MKKFDVPQYGLLASKAFAPALVLALGMSGCAESAPAGPQPSAASCETVTCGDGADCVDGACFCDEGLYGDPNVACVSVAGHLGWIGATCMDDLDCDYEGGLCLVDEEGFPHGYCSATCSLYCDDRDGAPTTFCVGDPDFEGGYCLSRCDVELYPDTDGCRPGYGCVERPRNTTDTTEFVCLPEEAW